MSRIGKKPIKVEEGVDIKLENGKVKVKGPKGELTFDIPPYITVEKKDNEVIVKPIEKFPKRLKNQVKALWGTTRAIINNMVQGVLRGYEKKLQIEGIGYKASVQGKDLILEVGFTHPVKVQCPEGIQFSVEKNIITVSGVDRQKVGQIAAFIRSIKKPDPYKGKGIRYVGEQIRKKLGKKAVGAGA
ncbi:50S ribosomal protein L6 [bacterium HR34]|nr:50S ribosomal protein L6 [bacterium HR34]